MMYVYILTNPGKKVLYTGVTNDLKRRMREHEKNKGKPETFAGKYYCYKLIHHEIFENPEDAIQKEKRELIAEKNPKINFYQILIYAEHLLALPFPSPKQISHLVRDLFGLLVLSHLLNLMTLPTGNF